VADNEPETPEDPWLTLAEIAEELRMSPATIRSWVADGTLRAMRPGKRKWFVRRSEVDRMLAGEDRYDPKAPETKPPADGWRPADFIEPPGRSPHWPPEAVEHVTRGGWLASTETQWRDVLRASAMAAPDEGFASAAGDRGCGGSQGGGVRESRGSGAGALVAAAVRAAGWGAVV
jgi:excisionase family DNA binding protein